MEEAWSAVKDTRASARATHIEILKKILGCVSHIWALGATHATWENLLADLYALLVVATHIVRMMGPREDGPDGPAGGIINERVFLPASEVPNGAKAGNGRVRYLNFHHFCGSRCSEPDRPPILTKLNKSGYMVEDDMQSIWVDINLSFADLWLNSIRWAGICQCSVESEWICGSR